MRTTPEKRAYRKGLALGAAAALGATVINKLYKSQDRPAQLETVAGTLFARAQFERASDALLFVVQRWNLSLNPEDVDLMAYVALKHATSTEPLETAEQYAEMETDVNAILDEDRADHERMLRLMDQSRQD
jgi:hypothetical protein